MKRRPPGSTRTDTLLPYTTLFRSLRARCGNGTGARLACRLVMAVLVFKRSRQGGTQVRRLMSHPAATKLATLTAEDCMKEESSRTLARPWAMLRGIHRSPLRVPTGELESSEEGRVGKEGGSTGRSRWSRFH